MMISVGEDTNIYYVQYVSAGIKIATFVSSPTDYLMTYN